MQLSLADVDLTNADVFETGTPHHMFKLLRQEAPVYWHQEKNGPGFWAITKYEDLKFVSKNPHLFSSARQGTLREDPPAKDLPYVQAIMLNMDPPKHRTYRALISKAFTPRMVEGLHGRIRSMVREIINTLIEKGECDFVDDVAAQLPLWVIAEMMGVPQEDRRHIYEIGNKMVGFDDPEYHPDMTPLDQRNAEEAFAEMFFYADKLREKARQHPSDDLATALLHAELDGERLTDMDFNFFFLLLLIAGNETTRTVTTNGMQALIDHPDQLRDLRADLSLLPGAIEEILRYAPAVHCFRRQSLGTAELRGQKIEPDQKLMLWYPSANRDEDIFHEPDTFNIRRYPNEHVAFGFGEHYCLGANLARMELNEIFRGILLRLHDIEPAAPPRRLRSTFINGVKEMRIRFRPGPIELLSEPVRLSV
ncbi:MAG TPA: cytochrome P450 [Terriglobales bacterium]|nr:cytochrome P450 [Terriglobales bacterium]